MGSATVRYTRASNAHFRLPQTSGNLSIPAIPPPSNCGYRNASISYVGDSTQTPKLLWACPFVAAISCSTIARDAASVPDSSLERVAIVESRLFPRLNSLVYNDARLRSEIKRIGYAKGCRAVHDSRREVIDEYGPRLVPFTVTAIRHVVPAERLNGMRVLSFLALPLVIYERRIDAELDMTAGPILRSADVAMRAVFDARTKVIATERNHSVNVIAPKADVAAAVGIKGTYDLDDPSQIGLACAELLISPGARPKISTPPLPKPHVVLPNP
jgi:hypothetical protein